MPTAQHGSADPERVLDGRLARSQKRAGCQMGKASCLRECPRKAQVPALGAGGRFYTRQLCATADACIWLC